MKIKEIAKIIKEDINHPRLFKMLENEDLVIHDVSFAQNENEYAICLLYTLKCAGRTIGSPLYTFCAFTNEGNVVRIEHISYSINDPTEDLDKKAQQEADLMNNFSENWTHRNKEQHYIAQKCKDIFEKTAVEFSE